MDHSINLLIVGRLANTIFFMYLYATKSGEVESGDQWVQVDLIFQSMILCSAVLVMIVVKKKTIGGTLGVPAEVKTWINVISFECVENNMAMTVANASLNILTHPQKATYCEYAY